MESGSTLEEVWRTLEEAELYERLFVDEMLQKPQRQRLKAAQMLYADYLAAKICDCHRHAQRICVSEELERESQSLACGPADLAAFYDRLAKTQEAHARSTQYADDLEARRLLLATHRESLFAGIDSQFTGEERCGRFLDLVVHHQRFLNLQPERPSYLQYVGSFENFEAVPRATKATGEYAEYVRQLAGYLRSFIERTQPFFALASFEADAREQFAAVCSRDAAGERGDLSCSACDRTFANPAVFTSHLEGKPHAKAAERQRRQREAAEAAGWSEFLVSQYSGVLAQVRDATHANIERKLSQLVPEAEDSGSEAEDLPDTEPSTALYNPLKLPLDWEGKPIPYWLWRLHGLGTQFPCEICGGYVYMGRKAFDRHFQEWRHAHGMKCLGIAAGRPFYGITKISDAAALSERLKRTARQSAFRPETMEEYEDERGNVFSRKTFEDLRRQGLI